MKNILLSVLILLLAACNSSNQNESIYWVNSAKVDCVGVGPMTCLQVQKSDTLNLNTDWNLFYSQIDGFDYKPGFIYKLKVKETPIENPPADASSIKYTLIKVIEKKNDVRFAIHDIWVLESMNGNPINSDSISKRPRIEINVAHMKIFGNNGCNQVSGSIKTLNETNIEFNPLMQTQMMCPNMELPKEFSNALAITKKYKKENTTLTFFDSEMKELLSFQKID